MTFDIRPATAQEMGQLGLMGAYSTAVPSVTDQTIKSLQAPAQSGRFALLITVDPWRMASPPWRHPLVLFPLPPV